MVLEDEDVCPVLPLRLLQRVDEELVLCFVLVPHFRRALDQGAV